MPVFGSKRETTPPDNTTTTTNEQERKGSRFGRRSVDNRTDNSSVTTASSQGQKRGGFLGIGGRNTTDPTILAAREKVTAAEQVCQWEPPLEAVLIIIWCRLSAKLIGSSLLLAKLSSRPANMPENLKLRRKKSMLIYFPKTTLD